MSHNLSRPVYPSLLPMPTMPEPPVEEPTKAADRTHPVIAMAAWILGAALAIVITEALKAAETDPTLNAGVTIGQTSVLVQVGLSIFLYWAMSWPIRRQWRAVREQHRREFDEYQAECLGRMEKWRDDRLQALAQYDQATTEWRLQRDAERDGGV